MFHPSADPAMRPAGFVKPRGGLTQVLQPLSSVLFKLSVYIFLRWIPTRQAFPIVPILYAVYLVTSLVSDSRLRSAITRFLEQPHPDADPSADLQQLAERIQTSTPQLEGKQIGAPVASSTLSPTKPADTKPAPTYAKVAAQGSEALKAPSDAPAERKQLTASSQRTSRTIGMASVPELFKAVVLGITSRSPRLNFYILLAHTLALAVFLDSFYSPYLFPSHLDYNLKFTRTAAISSTSAKLHVRWPHPLPIFNGVREDFSEGSGDSGVLRDARLPDPEALHVVWRVVPVNAMGEAEEDEKAPKMWERGPRLRLTEETDWTATARLDGLWPSTLYEWDLMFRHNGRLANHPKRFTTWPDPRFSEFMQKVDPARLINQGPNPLEDPNHFTFASTSCVKPDFPFHPAQFWAWNWILKLAGVGREPGGIAQRNRIPGFDLLYNRAIRNQTRPSLRFLLQLGDLIYADVPHYGGAYKHAYRKLYRNLFASDSFRKIYENIPTIGIYDDHEVVNNWSGETEDGTTLESFPPANTAWQEYVGRANPDPLEVGENYYTFQYGASAAFFVMDTRKHRSYYEQYDDSDKSMLGARQKDAFLRWLGAVNTTVTFKFVVSSVPFNTLWGGPLDWDGQKDSWAAYMSERGQLANVMQYIPNLIILSGDRHEFAATSIRDSITEFSTSPLSMFYLPVRTLSEDHGAGAWGEDKLYKYIPDGNHKWSEFEVDARDLNNPMVRISVQVDGKEAWNVKLLGKPVRRSDNVVGSIAKSLLEWLGLDPNRWLPEPWR